MSERGSFVTEYLYCGDCLAALEKLLRSTDVVEAVTVIHAIHGDKPAIIIAGKARGLAAGEELRNFQHLRPKIEHAICHPVTIAVLPDSAPPEFFEYQSRRNPS